MIPPTEPSAASAPAASDPPSQATDDFGRQMVALARLLEKRFAERASANRQATDTPNLSSGVWSLVLFAAFWLTPTKMPFVDAEKHPLISAGVPLILLILFAAFSIVFSLRMVGVTKKDFWRRLLSRNKPSRYPFTPVLHYLEQDLNSRGSLSSFSTEVLTALDERIALDEGELRERLSWFGSPSIVLIVGLVGAAWSAWEKLRHSPGSFTFVLFAAATAVLALGVAIIRLRFSLVELSQARAFLALELAFRKLTASTR